MSGILSRSLTHAEELNRSLSVRLHPPEPVEIEPQLRYTLATSLIQYVCLTNRYVRDMVNLDGYEAYIVRVQIGLMPLSRQAQYDTYVDIAFLPSETTAARTPWRAGVIG